MRSARMNIPSPAVLAEHISAALNLLASAKATGQAAITSSAWPTSKVCHTPHDGDVPMPTTPATSNPDRA